MVGCRERESVRNRKNGKGVINGIRELARI
jgi:hypothetical protein